MTNTTFSNASTSTTVCIIQLARRNKLLRSVEEGDFKLSPTPSDKIHNRSAPKIEGCLKKHYNRSILAKSIREFSATLKHVESRDRSAPFIDLDVKIRFSERRAFLHMLLGQVEKFYIRVLEAVVHVSQSSVHTAKYIIDNAPAKAEELLEKGRVIAHDAVEITVATTAATQVKAQEGLSEAVKTGKEVAASAKEAAASAKVNAQGRASLVSSLVKETATEVADAFKETGKEVADSFRETATIISSAVNTTAEDIRRAFNSRKANRLTRSATEEATIYAAYAELLRDVEKNRQDCLNHVLLSEIKDRSKPFIPSSEAMQQNKRSQQAYPFHARRMVLSEIKRSATLQTLNHVSMRDCSAPVLPTEIKCLTANPRKELLSELQSVSLDKLNPVPEVSDRSAPILPESVDLSKGNPMKLLLDEVKQGYDLAPVPEIKDRSAPLLEAGVCSM